MNWNQPLCILIYSVILVQCTGTLVVTYVKVKHSPALYALSATYMLAILWLILGMHEIQSTSTEALITATRLTLFPISIISGTWLIFTLLYTGMVKESNAWIYYVIMLPLIITYAPTAINRYLHLAILYKSINNPGGTIWGPALNINFGFTYTYMAISIVLLIRYAIKSYETERNRVLLLAFAPLVPVLIGLAGRFKFLPEFGFDLTPVTFSIMLWLQSLATFRYKAFDQLHHGALEVYRNTDEALIILDQYNRIVDFNTAAKKEFNLHPKDNNTTDMIPYFETLKNNSLSNSAIDAILDALHTDNAMYRCLLSLRTGTETDPYRYYDFSLKNIHNSDGRSSGRLISLKNRTQESNELLESAHRRISRNIHDGLSNLVNVIGMNLEYALDKGTTPEEIHHCVEVAFTTNNRLRFEIRKILDELVPLDLEKNGLLNALESLFKRITGTGLHLEFTPIGITEQVNRNLKLGLLLYSICLEGINNAMYNGKAHHVSIVIRQNMDNVRLILSDDGIGCEEIILGRGLLSIEAHVKDQGGKILFESIQGEGFNITMEVPYNHSPL